VSELYESANITGILKEFLNGKPMEGGCEGCGSSETRVFEQAPQYLFLNVQFEDGQKIKFEGKERIGEDLYLLKGMVFYMGNGYSGHYYAYVLSQRKWYKANDSCINQVNMLP